MTTQHAQKSAYVVC